MKRLKRTFTIENGFTFEKVRDEIKKGFSRRPITAYSKKDRSYVLTINLNDIETLVIVEALKQLDLNVELSNDFLICDVKAQEHNFNFSVLIADVETSENVEIEIDRKKLEYHASFKYNMLRIADATGDFFVSVNAPDVKNNDTSYKDFITKWALSWWTGNNGAYKLEKIYFN